MAKYSPLRWGFMGSGKIANDFALVLQSFPKSEHQIVAVAASDINKARDFAKLFNIAHAFEGYENVANVPEVDIVYVNGVHILHLECVKMALNGGKHVLCEKPLGVNGRQVKEMVELARQKRLFLMEAIWSRMFPIYHEIRAALTDGRIGEPRFVQGCFGKKYDPEETGRNFNKKLAGGAMLDIGCYLLQFVTMVFDGEKPEAVHVYGSLTDQGVDEADCITLKYKNGAMAQLTTSLRVDLSQKASVFGTEGMLELPGNFWNPIKVEINKKIHEIPLPKIEGQFNYPNSEGLAYEAHHVRECLQKGLTESPLMSLSDSETIVWISDEVRRQVGVIYEQDK